MQRAPTPSTDTRWPSRPRLPTLLPRASSTTQQTIATYIRAGAFPSIAAEAAGISVRTFHEWMARGEDRHPSRASTPKLRAFAKAVRRAHAEARVAAEIRVYNQRPAHWLTYAARTKPDRDGWTKPPEGAEEEDAPKARTLEDMMAELDKEEQRDAGCADSECRCSLHSRGPDGTRRPYGFSD